MQLSKQQYGVEFEHFLHIRLPKKTYVRGLDLGMMRPPELAQQVIC